MHARSIHSLPVEIWEQVFTRTLGYEDRARVMCVNRYFHSIAGRILYHSIAGLSTPKLIAFMQTICGNQNLAVLVRTLDIQWYQSVPTRNFYTLVNRGLCYMTALTDLTIMCSPMDEDSTHSVPTWFFHGCTFRLQRLVTFILCNRTLADFLDKQPSITHLSLFGYSPPSADEFPLSDSALPLLTSLRASYVEPSFVFTLIRGRPVEHVVLPPFYELSTLRCLALSTRRITSLTAPYVFADDHSLFAAIARYAPHLETLNAVKIAGSYNVVSSTSDPLRGDLN